MDFLLHLKAIARVYGEYGNEVLEVCSGSAAARCRLWLLGPHPALQQGALSHTRAARCTAYAPVIALLG